MGKFWVLSCKTHLKAYKLFAYEVTFCDIFLSVASFYPVKMLQTPLHIYALLLMSLLITDGINGIHFFKGAPNQFRKRKSIDREPDNSLAWVSQSYISLINITNVLAHT